MLPDVLLFQWKQENPRLIWTVLIQFLKTMQTEKMFLQAGFGLWPPAFDVKIVGWEEKVHAAPVPCRWGLVYPWMPSLQGPSPEALPGGIPSPADTSMQSEPEQKGAWAQAPACQNVWKPRGGFQWNQNSLCQVKVENDELNYK